MRSGMAISAKCAGLFIVEAASPRLEGREVSANTKVGLVVGNKGTDPQIVGNLIHDGKSAGVLITDGTSPRFEEGADRWNCSRLRMTRHTVLANSPRMGRVAVCRHRSTRGGPAVVSLGDPLPVFVRCVAGLRH